MPPEVRLAETQEHDLWRTGAHLYAPGEYSAYKASLRKGKDRLIKENSRLSWFRDYEAVQKDFKSVLAEGDSLKKKIIEARDLKSGSVLSRITLYQNRVETLGRLTSLVNEGRLARENLTKAEVMLLEAKALSEAGEPAKAETKLEHVHRHVGAAEDSLMPILNRFTDKGQIAMWRRWVGETVSDSKTRGGHAIVVSKIDRSLILYKAGSPVKTYSVGLGRNGSLDKLHAGDNATPEGKYYVTRKLPRSKYYKALLINYPNDEDRRRFQSARSKGLIPERVGIGGLIEIHGGGKEAMTYGCIALENRQMEELYNIIGVGTPVTIVGAIEDENRVSSALGGL